jgi:hypothetical protein
VDEVEEMLRPSRSPPNLRVVLPSAWVKASKISVSRRDSNACIAHGNMESCIESAQRFRLDADGNGPLSVNFAFPADW